MNVRRRRLISSSIALVVLGTAGLIFTAPGADADTAELDIAYEAWFGRSKAEDPVIDTCGNTSETTTPIVTTTTARQCGPTSPADSPAPQSKSTGHYVVASAGGDAGEDEGEGDLAWAAFQWDTFEYFDAIVEKFQVRLHLGLDRCPPPGTSRCFNQGDTYQGQADQTPPPIQACNILEGWSGEPGPNAWDTKPKVSHSCVAATWNPNNKREAIFDVTSFADSWVNGTGHGFVVRPGTPDKRTELQPFQITFAGYYDPGTESAGCSSVGVPSPGGTPTPTTPKPPDQACTRTDPGPRPKVLFAYTPAADDAFEDFDDFGDEDFFEDIDAGGGGDELEAIDLDIIPTDIGSEELATDELLTEGAGDDVALPTGVPGRTQPISTDVGFPWLVLLLLPIAAIAFWGTGTALGPVGDPVPARQGGVTRVLAERQAAHRGRDI